ncbi:hypothetical protein CMUS01_03680 [Colletotrichum musicola]|uniref:DUF2235 domain-containing protein n=1 Tax=Colletotrichum musicola TaxID=2175873 RepID=A0A8H6U5H5_9PEZI|nr:hypothetical protein CMUS01_03680 [Colletotrichum musicola]
MAASPIPRRLVICVDGTWFHPDGAVSSEGKTENSTNVYRLFASVYEGEVVDDQGKRLRPEDEVWLYGFSRGAFVVRAVAGLLHYISALTAADNSDDVFEKDYNKALKTYRAMQRENKLQESRIHEMLSSNTRPAPKIRFVGAFDTVKALNDTKLFDISVNPSIENYRHALALNETREVMTPECDSPRFAVDRSSLARHSAFVQAWFVGAHVDMGGSSEMDGLSLYPLQWMLAESRKLGLRLGFSSFKGRARIENPIHLVGLDTERLPWTCTSKNGTIFEMQDIRGVHKDNRHSTRINRAKGALWRRKGRTPFDQDGKLEGYCDFAPQGTFVHPSVYLLLDWQLGLSLDMQEFPFFSHLHGWRDKTLGYQGEVPVQGFWNDSVKWSQEQEELGAIRILVCGNVGIGKSSLINKVFGVDVTQSSDQTRGIHDVRDEITWPGRPDLIIHDSRGFEAGGVEEFNAVEKFLKVKSSELEVDKRLHAIWQVWWFCLETNDTRPIQRSTENLFRIVDKYAKDVPVIVIATKKDEFEGIKETELKNLFKREGRKATDEEKEAYAAEKLVHRLQEIEEAISGVDLHRFDFCMAVSKAISEAMRVYRNVLLSSTAMAGVPLGSTTNRFSGATNLCQTIVTCFGVQGVNKETIFAVYKANVVDDFGNSLATAVAEATSAMSLFCTIALGGLPLILVPMVSNIPLVVPTTARLLLMLSCDLILIFSRAFNEASAKCRAQPGLQDIQKAASIYQSHSKAVHAEVKILVPKLAKGMFKCYRTGEVELGVKEIIERFKTAVTEGVSTRAATFRVRSNTPRLSYESTTTLVKDDTMEEEGTVKETLDVIQRRLEAEEREQPSRVAEARTMMRQLQLG